MQYKIMALITSVLSSVWSFCHFFSLNICYAVYVIFLKKKKITDFKNADHDILLLFTLGSASQHFMEVGIVI